MQSAAQIGLDFWDNMKVATGYNGTYGTELFTNKAIDLIIKHDQSKVRYNNPYTCANFLRSLKKMMHQKFSPILGLQVHVFFCMATKVRTNW